MKYLIIALILSGCTGSISAEPVKDFKVFEELLFTNTPDLSSYGLKPMPTMGNKNRFWKSTDDTFTTDPDELVLRSTAASLPSSKEQDIYFIDIEHVHVNLSSKYTTVEWNDSITKVLKIINTLKFERPGIRYGFYSLLAERQYWPHAQTPEWSARNDHFVKKMCHAVDFVSPSLYTFYPNQLGWVEYAITMINEAKKCNKPVYPFIWPQYHNSSSLAGQLIPGDYWRLQLETIRLHADGVVIWGGWQVDWDASTSETDPTNWWYQTLDFIEDKGL